MNGADMDERDNTYEAYRKDLRHAGPREKGMILHRAEQEGDITYEQYLALCALAYPEGSG